MTINPQWMALAQRFAQLPAAQRAVFLSKLRDAGIDFGMLPIPPRAGGELRVPASFAQTRLWLHARIIDEAAAYHVSGRLCIDGVLDARSLQRAFDALLVRHEALRTCFAQSAEGVDQVIHPRLSCPWRFTDLTKDAAANETDTAATDANAPDTNAPDAARFARAERLAVEDEARAFDLENSPLLRVHVIRLAPRLHWLVLSMHHIVSDGWSINVMLGELAHLYAGETIPALPIQYADHALWQRRWLDAGEGERQRDFWRTQLAEVAQVIALPGSSARPARRSARGARHHFALRGEPAAQLRRLAHARRATPFAVLLAALYGVLGRAAGDAQRFCIGIPVANRERAESAGLIGFFVNTLAVAVDVEHAAPFEILVERVAAALTEAQAHQDVPFDQVVETLGIARSASHHPVFQVAASYSVPEPLPRLGAAQVSEIPLATPYAKFDLTLSIEAREAGDFDAALVYTTDIYTADAVARLADEYLCLLRAGLAQPGTPLGDLDWLSARDHRELAQWNAWQPETQWEQQPALQAAPQAKLQAEPRADLRTEFHAGLQALPAVHEMIAAHARRDPHAPALADATSRWTRGETDARAAALARRLVAAGVGAEIRVGIAVSRSNHLFVGLLAILKAGGAFVPLDPTHPRERLAYIVADAGIDFVITEQRHRDKLPLTARMTVWDIERDIDGSNPTRSVEGREASREASHDAGREASHEASSEAASNRKDPLAGRTSHAALPRGVAPCQSAYLIYTSGSTGKPKGVVVDHGSLAMHCRAIAGRYGMQEADRALHFMSINFDGAHECWMAPLSAGMSLRVTDDALWPPGQTCETMAQEGVTIAAFPPGYAVQLAEWALRHGAPPSLRSLTVGGEATSREAFAILRRAFPAARIVNGYGPTETVITPLLWMIDAHADDAHVSEAYLPIGAPVGERTAHVLDARLQRLPVGVTGELYLGGTGVARGYHARPALTATQFVPDPYGTPGARLYRTGDLVRRNADGILEFVGRVDHQVKLRGLRIELGEIEARLAAHADVRNAVAMVWGTGADALLVAYVEPAAAAADAAARGTPLAPETLLAHLRDALPDYMVPAHLIVLDALPRNANRKLDRAALPAPVRAERAFEAPVTALETALSAIWRGVLGLPRVGRREHFFDAGGHSLAAVKVASRVADELARDVPVRVLFEAPTLAEYALRVQQCPMRAAATTPSAAGSPAAGSPAAGPSAAGPAPTTRLDTTTPTGAQRALWFLWAERPDNAAYHIPLALRLHGTLNAAALHEAFTRVARRHPALHAHLVARPGAAPVWAYDASAPAAVPVTDLRGTDPDDALAHAVALVDAEALRPFDLYRAPLWRASLLRLGEDDHVLSLVVHHIVADGKSIDLWLDALTHAYAAALQGVPEEAVPGPERDWLATSPTRAADAAFWRARLQDAPRLALPGPRRPAQPRWLAGRLAFAVDAPVAQAARTLATASHATLPLLMQAAFNLALREVTGAVDQSLGVLASTRDAASDTAIGLFINAVVVRTQLGDDLTPRRMLTQVRDATFDAYAHAGMPFADVVTAVRAERAAGRNPLFQAMFNYLRPGDAAARVWPGLQAADFNDKRYRVVFDLELDIVEHADARVTGAFSYAREIVDAAFVERLARTYQAVLARFVSDPDGRLPVPVAPSGQCVPSADEGDANAIVGAVAPSSTACAAARALQQIWRTLGKETPCAPTDNLFEQGATSFDVLRFVDAARHAGLRFSIADVFTHQTFAALAETLAARSTEPSKEELQHVE
ncbi:MAG: amino acid adenylation domain-containing protein [Janthinobacterium lividum]